MSLAARSRNGLSAVEFVACLSAMVGGVILGSMYLGVDVKRMGMAVLKQAQLIESTEVESTATVATTETEPSKTATPVTAAETTAASEPKAAPPVPTAPEAATLATQEAVVESPPAAAELDPVPPLPPASTNPLVKLLDRDELISLTDDQRRTLTIAYWEALDACMKDEVKNRLASIRPDGNFTLFDFLTCRKQGHQQAMEFISQLNLRGVDPHIAAYAEKALAWHKDGVTLFSRALDLLTDAPTAQFTGPFAQSWQSASTQHQMEERLLCEKQVAVQDYLDHTLLAEAATAAATPVPAAATANSPAPIPAP